VPQQARREALFDRAVTYALGAMIVLLTVVLYLAAMPPAWVQRLMGW
jgi:hypothetical protein